MAHENLSNTNRANVKAYTQYFNGKICYNGYNLKVFMQIILKFCPK